MSLSFRAERARRALRAAVKPVESKLIYVFLFSAALALILGVIASAALRAASAPRANMPRWQDELVDKLGLVGVASSIALDGNGYAHIAYYDATYHAIKYAVWDGIAWQLDTVERDLGDYPGVYPFRSAIAVHGGTAYIVYEKYDATNGRRYLRFAFGGVGGWNISTLGASDIYTYAYAPSLRRDGNGSLHVSYTLRNPQLPDWPQKIIYARLDVTSTNWFSQTADTLSEWEYGIVSSLALDSNNHPQIVYGGTGFPANPQTMVAARLSGATWLTQTVTTDGNWPSLAVDSAGNPHVAFINSAFSPNVEYASWNGSSWQIQNVITNCSCSYSAPSLALDVFNNPRLAIGDHYAQWNGSTWAGQTLPIGNPAIETAFALDAAGNPHLSYLDAKYDELHHVYWATDWQTQTVAVSGTVPRLAVDIHNLPFVSYDDSSLNLQLANWTTGGSWQYRNVASDAFYNFLRLQYDVNLQPLPILSYQDVAKQHLDYAQWNGSTFVTQTVDAANNVGYWTSLAFDYSAEPIIAYYDLGNKRIKLATSNGTSGTSWTIRTDTVGPSVHNSWISIGGSPLCCKTYIGYVDGVSLTLRLATWDGTQWTDELVDGGNGDQIENVSLAVDRTTGEPAMAYYDLTHGLVKYTYRSGGHWVVSVVDSGIVNLQDISLALALYSNQYPRILYTNQADNSLRLAWTEPTSTWTIETIGNAGYLVVSSQAQTRDHIAFVQQAPNNQFPVVYAFHSATLPYPLYYNPLQPCVNTQSSPASVGRALARVRASRPDELPQLDDLTILRALRDLFTQSAAGQRYINLYYQYAPETGRLSLADPSLLWDSYRTLQNLLPGLASLAAGNGNDIVMTQSMVDRVNNIADRLVVLGSPALGTAINTERANYNHLQVFVGKTFKQAGDILGLYRPITRIFLPLILK